MSWKPKFSVLPGCTLYVRAAVLQDTKLVLHAEPDTGRMQQDETWTLALPAQAMEVCRKLTDLQPCSIGVYAPRK